jgi:hypothetical protein
MGSTKLGSRRLVPRSEIDRLIAEGTVPATNGQMAAETASLLRRPVRQ